MSSTLLLNSHIDGDIYAASQSFTVHTTCSVTVLYGAHQTDGRGFMRVQLEQADLKALASDSANVGLICLTVVYALKGCESLQS